MSKLDIIILTLLLAGALIGYKWGVVFMAFSVISLLVGLWLISTNSASISAIVSELDHHVGLYVAICAGILVLSLAMGKAASWLVEKVLKLVFMNWVNKGIGAVIGLVAVWLFLSFIFYSFRKFPENLPVLSEADITNSRLAKPLSVTGSRLPGISRLGQLNLQLPQSQEVQSLP